MAPGIDHVVHAVRDLEAAAALYRRLGFTVGARNVHPPSWGTHNRIVQFPGTFVELLAVADSSQTVPHSQGHFSFGAFNRDFLARGEGLSMLALQGTDEAADCAERYRELGIGDFTPFHFQRAARRPDGSSATVAFSLAFACDPAAPDIGFFACRHHHPENFWDAAYQAHPNTAAGVAGVVLVAENPSDHHIFLSAFTGERELRATSSGISLKTARGEIEVVTPAALADRFGAAPPDLARGARLAAVRFSLREPAKARAALQSAQCGARERLGRIVVPPEAAMGATLVFEPAG